MAILTKGQTFADGDQVTSSKLNNLVDAATFASGAVDGTTILLDGGGYLKVGVIQSGNLAAGSVQTATLSDSSSSTTGVTTAKLATGAVTTAKITDANVTTAKLADGAVTTAKITDANVTAAKLSGAQTGSAPVYGIRAWGKFAGQGTDGACVVSASGNVTGVSRISDGVYEVTMTTALADANYAVTSTSGASHVSYATFTETTTAFRLEFKNASNVLTNPTEISFMVIR